MTEYVNFDRSIAEVYAGTGERSVRRYQDEFLPVINDLEPFASLQDDEKIIEFKALVKEAVDLLDELTTAMSENKLPVALLQKAHDWRREGETRKQIGSRINYMQHINRLHYNTSDVAPKDHEISETGAIASQMIESICSEIPLPNPQMTTEHIGPSEAKQSGGPSRAKVDEGG